jgi:hypothetical protein
MMKFLIVISNVIGCIFFFLSIFVFVYYIHMEVLLSGAVQNTQSYCIIFYTYNNFQARVYSQPTITYELPNNVYYIVFYYLHLQIRRVVYFDIIEFLRSYFLFLVISIDGNVKLGVKKKK